MNVCFCSNHTFHRSKLVESTAQLLDSPCVSNSSWTPRLQCWLMCFHACQMVCNVDFKLWQIRQTFVISVVCLIACLLIIPQLRLCVYLHLSLDHYFSLSYLMVFHFQELLGVLPCKLINYCNDVRPEKVTHSTVFPVQLTTASLSQKRTAPVIPTYTWFTAACVSAVVNIFITESDIALCWLSPGEC